MIPGTCADHFIGRQRFPAQSRNRLFETGIEGCNGADRSPLTEILQHRPEHAERLSRQARRAVSPSGTASSGKEFIHKNS